MNRVLAGAAAVLLVGATAVRLSLRWREERADRRISILADWSEIRDASVRQGLTDQDLLERLHNAGVNGVIAGGATVEDFLWPDSSSEEATPAFSKKASADLVLTQMLERGIAGVTVRRESGKYRLFRPQNDWLRLKDVEIGFNPEFLEKVRQADLHVVLRINNDPWLTQDMLFHDLEALGTGYGASGLLLNTDEVPGGPDALPRWNAFLNAATSINLLFEFHPAKSAVKLALRAPGLTYRSHTIAANELKDLNEGQQRSRWRRALEERSCRFLLFHVSPNDSLASFLEGIYGMKTAFQGKGWQLGWPEPRLTWTTPTFLERQCGSLMALLVAIVSPVLALRLSLRKSPAKAYAQIALLTFAGACMMAAMAGNPFTRLEVVPFRGIKLAFAAAWVGCLLSLYTWEEIHRQLLLPLRRLDVVLGILAAAAIGYLAIRMGNAGAGWKPGWEQSVRDRLEDLFVARPRFKEFAIGYPLLFCGLKSRTDGVSKAFWRDGRWAIAVGMIGPISMVNTFCHLHSPLYLAFWRSLNGFAIGTLIGVLLFTAVRRTTQIYER